MSSRLIGYLFLLLVYAFALACAWATALYLPFPADPLWRAAIADVLATLVVFGFSVMMGNSSMYDPYWSVAPPALFAYWASLAPEITPRAMIVGGLIALWGARLTYNFLRGFADLAHQDWRYIDLQAKHGKAYWLVSFGGIHMFPTVLTFAGSVSAHVVLMDHDAPPLGWLDGAAALVTLLGIAYEAIADEQLRAFVRAGPEKGTWLRTGLWKHSRHPNYFGEVTFWIGLALFATSSAPSAWWVWIGPAGVLVLFYFVSIPLIDARMVARRPGYAAYMGRVSRLLPWPVRDAPP